KANVRQGHFDQEHFQRHDHLVFWGLQSKKDSVACLGEEPLTLATEEDAPFATLGQIGRDGAHVAPVHQPIMRTVHIGARLPPVLGFAHGSNLQSWYSAIHTDRKFGFFSFSKYYRVSTQNPIAAPFDDFDLVIEPFYKSTCLSVMKVIGYFVHPFL